MLQLFPLVFTISCYFAVISGSALHPIRYPNEEAFFKANTHERSMNLDEMNEKIRTMRERRKHVPWDLKNNDVLMGLNSSGSGIRRPNILFMLADDLGYGDLSVAPFTTVYEESKWPCLEGGILSPRLEGMAKNGAIMTNFHASAPVCSPSRASIVTGLYPWRMTAMNAFELGRDMMQRNGFLPQIPTTAELLRELGYNTFHSGKWHLGGMREEQRVDRVRRDDCSVPSPNQHGFEDYISELDGPESPRYTFLNSQSILHSQGHRHLLRNDVPMPIIEKEGVENVLSDREASDAIDQIRYMTKHQPQQPWFVQVWFNAPHGPWEPLKSGEAVYASKYRGKISTDWSKFTCKNNEGKDEPLYGQRWFYKTMVTAMDRSIGMLLDALDELGIAENTLVVFTSDNGPELGAGMGGMYKEGKRSLMEGGVRVPAIFQWKGHIPANSFTTFFGAHTDLLPTFLDVATGGFDFYRHHEHFSPFSSERHASLKELHHKQHKPTPLQFDGISLLSVLEKATPVVSSEDLYSTHLFRQHKHLPGEREIQMIYFSENVPAAGSNSTSSSSSDAPHRGHFDHDSVTHNSDEQPISRVFLWHKDTDPYSRDQRMQSAGYYEYVKVISNTDQGCVDRIFDMRHDPTERNNLLVSQHRHSCALNFHSFDLKKISEMLPSNIAHGHCEELVKHLYKDSNAAATQACVDKYHSNLVHKVMTIMKHLAPFAIHGNEGHLDYLATRRATCDIPVASKVRPLNYLVKGDRCTKTKEGCTAPLY